MSLSSLLTTPAPPHAFLIDHGRLAYANLNRGRNALQRVEVVALQDEWFRLGPVGVLQVERQSLATALATVGERLGKLPSRASLVIPNDWVRTVLLEADGLPRQHQEAEDVLRWRLKKLLPCRPEEVRLDWVPTNDGERVLVMLTLDRPLTSVDEAFSGAGVSLGRIEPMALALSALLLRGAGLRLLVMLEPRSVGLVVLGRSGDVLLVRHKVLLGNPSQAAAFLVRELSRTSSHAREREPQGTGLEVLLFGTVEELEETVMGWASREPGITVRRLALESAPWPPTTGLDPIQLAALLATAARGEG